MYSMDNEKNEKDPLHNNNNIIVVIFAVDISQLQKKEIWNSLNYRIFKHSACSDINKLFKYLVVLMKE